MTPPTTEQAQAIHNLYVIHSGMDMRYTTYHGFVWERFLHEGFTEDDVVNVCKYLRHEIKSGKSKLTMASLKFRNLIEDLPAFADHRAMAVAASRKPNPEPEVLWVNGHPKRATEPAGEPAGAILSRTEIAARLKEWRENQL